MNKKELLKEIQDDVFTRLKPSSIEGVGVFAIKPIPKGTNPFRGDTREVDYVEFKPEELDCEPEIKRYIQDMCVFEDGVYYLPDVGVSAFTQGWYLNHSKEPNMATEDGGDQFIAIRDIEVGEELIIDYGTYNQEEDVFNR